MSENLKKLQDLLQFDPAKESANKGVLDKALEKITQEREGRLQADVEKLLSQAIDLARDWDKAKKEWASKEKKMDKTLGSIVNKLLAIQNNQPIPSESEDKDSTEG